MSEPLPLPPWLHDEPQLLRLFGAVLDRFDQQGGETRQQRLNFSALLPAARRWGFINRETPT